MDFFDPLYDDIKKLLLDKIGAVWTIAILLALAVVLFVLFHYDKIRGNIQRIKYDFWNSKEKLGELLKGYCKAIKCKEKPTLQNVANHCSLSHDEVKEYTKIAYDKGLLKTITYDRDLRAEGAPLKYFFPTEKGINLYMKTHKAMNLPTCIKDYLQTLRRIPHPATIAACIILIVACIHKMSPSYHTFLRVTICAYAIFAAIHYYKKNTLTLRSFLAASLALLFNPAFPIDPYEQENWIALCIPSTLLIYLFLPLPLPTKTPPHDS